MTRPAVAARPTVTSPTSTSPELLETAAFIDRYGMNIIHVGRGCRCSGCADTPLTRAQQFGYTIGLSGLGHPELLLRGFGAAETTAILSRWGEVVLDGDTLDAGHLLCEGRGGATWELVPVQRPSRTLHWAARYYSSGEVDALELIPARRPCSCGGCD
ncbi:DUF4262 domain-containing protein [Dietzia sp. NCCP-2495]|uniref:DUF4262 domain-containing protein n=1 Tax=Dietzia sp. NCCP-2495 TaxID=2934675 RepID=UPI00222FBB3F|nr:DUF4262 domain-containing protein [Dietzia sp. NCCP-2495]